VFGCPLWVQGGHPTESTECRFTSHIGLKADIVTAGQLHQCFLAIGGSVKHHVPLPIAIYANIGAIIATVANFGCLLDCMNPGDRAADIDLVR
jgi:hypothetical protein